MFNGVFSPSLLAVLAAPFIGSFLGLVATRLPAGMPILWGRSRCGSCTQVLRPVDLIPLVSWILFRGRCRYCAAPIERRYPVLELSALLVAVWAATAVGGWLTWATCGLGWALLTLAAIDFRHQMLPDVMTLPLMAAGLAIALFVDADGIADHAAGAAAGFLLFAGVGWLYRVARGRSGLGFGDAKLLGAIGAWVSWVGLPSVIAVASASALLFVGARRLRGATVTATDRVPFGPFLGLGGWLVWLYGPLVVG